MRILLVTPYFLEKGKAGRGALMYIDRFAKSLVKLGHTPIIISGGNVDKYMKVDGIDVYKVDTYIIRTNNQVINQMLDCIIGNFILEKKVKNICSEQKIDIIQYLGNNGGGLFHYSRIPAVLRMTCYYKVTFVTDLQVSKWQKAIHSFIEREATKRMDGIYCPSEKLAKDVSKDIKRRVQVIESPFYNEVNKMDYSVYDKYLAGKKYLLFYGAITPEKGTLLIADIAEKVLSKYKDYYIVFIGKDSRYQEKSALEEIKKKTKMVSSQMIYINELQHIYLYPIIQKAQLVMLPSYMENLANACFEAMYFKKIVIGTNGASFEQLITDSVNGYLFEQGNAEDLYRCVERALELPEGEKKIMEEKAKKRIERMRPEITVNKAVRYYQYILSHYKKK